jgi:hypothetical protein
MIEPLNLGRLARFDSVTAFVQSSKGDVKRRAPSIRIGTNKFLRDLPPGKKNAIRARLRNPVDPSNVLEGNWSRNSKYLYGLAPLRLPKKWVNVPLILEILEEEAVEGNRLANGVAPMPNSTEALADCGIISRDS